MGVEHFLGYQRDARQVLGELLLRGLVERGALGAVGGDQRLGNGVIEHLVAVEGVVGQLRRPRLGGEQRAQRPVGLAGGRRPADVVHAQLGGLGIGPGIDQLHALAGLQRLHRHLDAHLLQLLLQELDHLLAGGVVVVAPQRRFEAVGVAGFLQQFPGLGHVVGNRLHLHGVFHALGHEALGREGVAVECHLGQRVLVDGVADGLAHLDIVEGLLQVVQHQEALDDGRAGHHLHLVALLQRGDLLVRQREGEVGLARLQHGGAGVVLGDGLPGDLVDLGIALLPVVRELLAHDGFGLLPLHELERAGTHGMEGDVLVAPLGECGGGDHRGGGVAQRVDEGAEGLLERDAQGLRVHGLDLGHAVELVGAQQAVGRVHHAVQVGLGSGGVEVGAVVELHARTQLEGVHQAVLGDFVALGQHVLELHVLVESEQAFVEALGDGRGDGRVGVVRVQRLGLLVDGQHGVAGGQRRAGGGQGGQCQQAGGDAAGSGGLLHGGLRLGKEHQYRLAMEWRATKCPGPTSTSGCTAGSSPMARMGLGMSPSSSARLRWRRAGSAMGTAAMSFFV